MQHDAPISPLAASLMGLIVVLVGSGCLAVWGSIAYRLMTGRRILPSARPRLAPWSAGDLLLVLFLYLGASVVMSQIGVAWLGREAFEPPRAAQAEEEPTADHAVARLLRQSDHPAVFLLAVLMAVVVAPITEEVLFRLLLQGYLEKLAWRAAGWRRSSAAPEIVHAVEGTSAAGASSSAGVDLNPYQAPLGPTTWRGARRLHRYRSPWGLLAAMPILTASLLFALMHFRTSGASLGPSALMYMLGGTMVVNLAVVALAVAWIWMRTGATAREFGFVPARFWDDVRLGLLAFLAVGPPIYLIQALATWLLSGGVAPDPIPLFFFATVLGLLYCRSRRIVASIVLHMALNGTTMVMLGLTLVAS